MKINHALTMVAVVALALFACGLIPPAFPTTTPANTPAPAAALTPIPANTPKPAITSTLEPVIEFGELQAVEEGGYSFRPPIGYEVDVQGAQAGVFDHEGTIIISIFGATSNPQNLSPDEILDEFVTAVFKKGDGEYKKENPHTVRVDGVDGMAYDITGTLFGSPLRGQAVIVMPNDDQYLFGLGIANTGGDRQRWENEGGRVFGGLIDSITFSTPEQTQPTGGCVISADKTYGYTQENPIKVGGDAFGGPARERVYLDNLLGANGEKISYERIGSQPFENTILDVFEVTIAGEKLTLYIDEYAFTAPQAPVGFTCVSVFPLASP